MIDSITFITISIYCQIVDGSNHSNNLPNNLQKLFVSIYATKCRPRN